MDVPIPRKPTSNEIQQWKLRKEYLSMVKDSPFHLTAPPPPPDIERYSDKYKVAAPKRSLREIETSKRNNNCTLCSFQDTDDLV
jgi:DNA-directed RNA polymerase III subunit RPC7